MNGKLTVCIVLAFLIQVGAPQLPGQSSGKGPSNSPTDAAVNGQTVNRGKSVGFQERYPRYQVLDGDTMDLVFEFSPEFNQTVTVQPDGSLRVTSPSQVVRGTRGLYRARAGRRSLADDLLAERRAELRRETSNPS